MWTSGKLARKGVIQRLAAGGELGRVEFVDDLEAAAVEDLVDQSPDGRLVEFGHDRSLPHRQVRAYPSRGAYMITATPVRHRAAPTRS